MLSKFGPRNGVKENECRRVVRLRLDDGFSGFLPSNDLGDTGADEQGELCEGILAPTAEAIYCAPIRCVR